MLQSGDESRTYDVHCIFDMVKTTLTAVALSEYL